MNIRTKISPSDAVDLWNDFALSFPSTVPYSFNPSLFFFFQQHFNWKPYYFILQDNGTTIGLLPVVNTGKAWVSLPHFSYGGILTNRNIPKAELIDNLLRLVKENHLPSGFYKVNYEEVVKIPVSGVDTYFIRSFGDQRDDAFKSSEKATYVLKVKEQETLFESLGSNLRRKIRKASEKGFEFRTGKTALLDDFYSVYTRNIRLLHSLNYDKRFFKDLLDAWDFGAMDLFVVYQKGKPVASALTASYGSFYENLYFATLPEVRKDYISDWLHWQMITHFLSSGRDKAITYSFGRSTVNSSVHRYKKHWPVEVIPLYVYSNLDTKASNPVYHTILKLLPGSLVRMLSPHLIKHIY